jgi:hypothetical protein
MLQTQLLDTGAGRRSRRSGFGAAYNPTDVKALQEALQRAGKSVRTDGVMDGNTLAALYELIRDRGGATASAVASAISTKAGTYIQKLFAGLQDLDRKLGKVPGVSLSIPSLLRKMSLVSQITSVAQQVCSRFPDIYPDACEVASKLQNALNEFFSAASSAAKQLAQVVYVLVPEAAPTTTPPPTAKFPLDIKTAILEMKALPGAKPPAETYPPGTIYARASKMPGWYRIAIPLQRTAGLGIAETRGTCVFGDCGLGAEATHLEVEMQQTPPPGATPTTETELEKKTGKLPWYKKWQVWAAIGGAVVVGSGAVIYVRRRRRM